jgi:hypothetical protein
VSSLFDLPIGEDENDIGKSHRSPNFVGRIFGHIEAAPIFTLSNGHPVNVLTGADDEHGGAYPFASRPLGRESVGHGVHDEIDRHAESVTGESIGISSIIGPLISITQVVLH